MLMAVPAVWRLINLLAFIEPKQNAKAHRRDACAPLPKSKSKLLLVCADAAGMDFRDGFGGGGSRGLHDLTPMPSALFARRLRSRLWCQKQVGASDRGCSAT